jgi:hypothetical protein
MELKELFSIRHLIKDMDSQEKKRFRHLLDPKNHTKYEKENIDMAFGGFWDSYFYYRKSPLDEFGYLGN